MPQDNEQLEQRVATLERELAALKSGVARRGVRKRSEISLCGLPLYDIALGPDLETKQSRGHARGILAIGDIAVGGVAIGGLALGVFAFGGCAISLLLGAGGLAVGAAAFGGAAVGGIAFGGAAAGVVAIGGAAVGYYACAGDAEGRYVLSALRQDPEAIRFFTQWIPGIELLVPPKGK